MLLSSDIIKYLLQDRDKLMCHKGGDIAMAMWIENLEKTKNIRWFADNARILHNHPVATYIDVLAKREEICHTFISFHGVYGNDSHTLNDIIKREKVSVSLEYSIPRIVNECPKTQFRWQSFKRPYYAVPKLCSNFPLFSRYKMFRGRTDGKYR